MIPNLTIPAIHRIDATKLNCYESCPREFFYRHVLGWEGDEPSNHLVFGSAVHKGQEVLQEEGNFCDYSSRWPSAYQAFLEEYRKTFSEGSDLLYAPKTPADAERMFEQYAEYYQAVDSKDFIEYVEVAGTVPIDKTRKVHFKIDTILRNEMGYFSREHKTTGTRGFSRQWKDQWILAMQTGVYTHVLHCLYPPNEVQGVQINGMSFLKNREQNDWSKLFFRTMSNRTPDQMQVWLWNTKQKMIQIEKDLEALHCTCNPDSPFMTAFEMRTGSCTKYFGCPYHDFCCAWPNPLKFAHTPPPGFHVRHWDPQEVMESAKHKMEF